MGRWYSAPSPLPSPAPRRKCIWGANRRGKSECSPAERTANSSVVVVGVRDQGEEARALDARGQLALVLRLGAGHAARHDLAGLGEVLAQGVEILVIDLGDALGGELAELAAAEELGHGCAPQASTLSSAGVGSVLSGASPSLSSPRGGRAR